MAYKGAGFGSNSTMQVPNRGPLNGPWVAPAKKASSPASASSPKVGRNSPVGGGSQFNSSKSASPKVGRNSPVGGGSNFAQSAPAMKPDTSNHAMGGGSKLPASAPRPTARPSSTPKAKNQTYYAGDAPRNNNPYDMARYKAGRSR